jgi:hypothetical protein
VKERRLKNDIHEIKKTTQSVKEELNKDMDNLREKNQTETLEIKKSLYLYKKHSGMATIADYNQWKIESKS